MPLRKLLILLMFAALARAQAPNARAVLIGISQYRNLPKDLWLQYADADATALSRLLASPRGGAIPAGNMIVLTNERATTEAIRAALHTLTQDAATPNSTIYLLVAAHGTVDKQGAYILTYDSDPGNLAGTALPMAELQTLVQHDLAAAAHVVFLADVCRAATIGNLKTAAIGNAVEQLGEGAGEMLGLMAARPAELSFEGPQFGGGHGAFTWSVLEGLGGKADSDGDGAVTAGELIDYVRGSVSRLTNGKQHPRDFGNMDNGTRLADTSKIGPS